MPARNRLTGKDPRNRSSRLLFLQRSAVSRVQSPMSRDQFGFLRRKTGVTEILQASSVLMMILMAIAFFAGCQSSAPKNQTDQNSMIREPEGPQVHGEVGASYGRSG